FAARLLRAAPLGLLATAATFLATLLGMEGVVMSALDPFAWVRAPRADSGVVVVQITDRDYRRLFGGRSPLDAARVEELVRAIGAGRPRVIGIDLDTSDPTFRAVRPVPGVPVIWAREVVECEAYAAMPVGCAADAWVFGPVLGGRNPPDSMAAVSLYPDPDGVIRRYRRTLRGPGGPVPTLGAALGRFGRDAEEEGRPGERMIVYRPVEGRWTFAASAVLDLARSPGWADGVLRGKVVLLGGSYRAARDAHPTPLGPLPGVEVWAQVAETEMYGEGFSPPAPLAVTGLAFLHGVLVLVLFQRLCFERAVAWSVGASLVLAPGSSLLVTGGGTAGLWLYFLPIWGTVLAQQLFDSAKSYRDAWVAGLYQQVAVAEPLDAQTDDA
ncbi:MAG TPA: CHASE2 domain-containing protein, partial [Longimicrobium sp.]|nr:CHASE2 domain-containing protein [Longimicrobium sp.]